MGDVRVAFMQALMRAAFPALTQHTGTAVVTMSTGVDHRWDMPLQIDLDIYPAASARQDAPPRRSPYLHATFDFDGDVFRSASLFGDAVSQSKSEQLSKLADAGALATESQVAEALARLGATFGPDKKAEFRARLNLSRFAEVIGGIRQADIAFTSPAHRVPPSYSGPPRWRVAITTSRRSPPECVVLLFEPFEGQLVGALRGDLACR
jgi:hypothetical protein